LGASPTSPEGARTTIPEEARTTIHEEDRPIRTSRPNPRHIGSE